MAITTSLDKVRLEIGDTDSTAQLLQDDEITYLISQERTLWGAAARCCEVIARNFLRKADVRIGRGGTMLNYSTAAQQYFQMAKEFRARSTAMNAPWSGGLTVSEKETLAGDDSLVQPLFAKGQFNNTFAGNPQSVIADQDDD